MKVTMLMSRLTAPQDVEKGVVLSAAVEGLAMASFRGSPCSTCFVLPSSSLSGVHIVADEEEEEDPGACESNVSFSCGWTAMRGDGRYTPGFGFDCWLALSRRRLSCVGTSEAGRSAGVASERVVLSREQIFSQFGHRPCALGPCSHYVHSVRLERRLEWNNVHLRGAPCRISCHNRASGKERPHIQSLGCDECRVRHKMQNRTHQIPQSRSTDSFFRDRSLPDDARHDGRRAGTRGTAMPACAHCATKALFSTRLGVLADGDSAPRSKIPQSYSDPPRSSSMLPRFRGGGIVTRLRKTLFRCDGDKG